MMAVTGLRLLAQMLAMLYLVLAAGVFLLFGLEREAWRAVAIGGIIAWAVAPDKESRDRYLAFQRQRMPNEPK